MRVCKQKKSKSKSASKRKRKKPSASNKKQNPSKKQKPPRKPSKYASYVSAPKDAIYFLFDIETTGSKRNFDRIIALSFLAYDTEGRLLDHFSRKVNPQGVSISAFLSHRVHSKFVVYVQIIRKA